MDAIIISQLETLPMKWQWWRKLSLFIQYWTTHGDKRNMLFDIVTFFRLTRATATTTTTATAKRRRRYVNNQENPTEWRAPCLCRLYATVAKYRFSHMKLLWPDFFLIFTLSITMMSTEVDNLFAFKMKSSNNGSITHLISYWTYFFLHLFELQRKFVGWEFQLQRNRNREATVIVNVCCVHP